MYENLSNRQKLELFIPDGPLRNHLRIFLTVYNRETLELFADGDLEIYNSYLRVYETVCKYFDLLAPDSSSKLELSSLPETVQILTHTDHSIHGNKDPIQLYIDNSEQDQIPNETHLDSTLALLLIHHCIETWLYTPQNINTVNMTINRDKLDSTKIILSHEGQHILNSDRPNHDITYKERLYREERFNSLRDQGYSIDEIFDGKQTKLIISHQ